MAESWPVVSLPESGRPGICYGAYRGSGALQTSFQDPPGLRSSISNYPDPHCAPAYYGLGPKVADLAAQHAVTSMNPLTGAMPKIIFKDPQRPS